MPWSLGWTSSRNGCTRDDVLWESGGALKIEVIDTAQKITHPSFVRFGSDLDASVNWVKSTDIGQIEARYVRRDDRYIVVYLSSQSGCQQACRMCHLTATKQTRLRDVTQQEFLQQADIVLDHYRTQKAAQEVHFNFMARGEPLASSVLQEHSGVLMNALWERAKSVGLRARFLVSTIMPGELEGRSLLDIFDRYQPEIYYSLYSTNETFRRRWLPKAMPVPQALDVLSEWQRHSYKLIKVHYAFIKGENDSESDVHAVCDALQDRGLYAHFNIVRYNPPGVHDRGQESELDILRRNAAIFSKRFPQARVRIIPRVGFDVHASCGMFVTPV